MKARIPAYWKYDKRVMALLREFAGYPCAGVDQDTEQYESLPPCQKCGPCEANALLIEMEAQK